MLVLVVCNIVVNKHYNTIQRRLCYSVHDYLTFLFVSEKELFRIFTVDIPFLRTSSYCTACVCEYFPTSSLSISALLLLSSVSCNAPPLLLLPAV